MKTRIALAGAVVALVVYGSVPTAAQAPSQDFTQCHIWQAVPDKFVWAQLWNPEGSTVDLHVTRLSVASNSAVDFTVTSGNVPLADFRNFGHSRVISDTHKASGVGQLRGEVATDYWRYQHASTHVLHVVPSETLSLPTDITVTPGWGFQVVTRKPNTSLTACYEWTEVPA